MNPLLKRNCLPSFEEIKVAVPTARVLFSAPFPRVPSWCMDEVDVLRYNIVSWRIGRDVQTRGTYVIFSKGLWTSIRKAKANDRCYRSDGLHLLPAGTLMVARNWLRACHR